MKTLFLLWLLASQVTLPCRPGEVRVAASSEGTVRISMGQRPPSLVVRPPTPVRMTVATTENGWTVTHRRGRIEVRRDTAAVRILDNSGRVLVEDHPRVPLQRGDGFRVTKLSSLEEHYFGVGDKPGALDRRHQACTLWNTDAYLWQESTDPLYKSVPFVLGLRHGRAWGLYLDNSYRSTFEFQKLHADGFSFGAEGGPLDYYVFPGPEPKDVLRQYTALLGRSPLPPLWALGYQQSRGSYLPEARVREVARQLREHRIPCDVLYLDGDYKEGARPFTVDRQLFPHFEKLLTELAALGFHTVISLDPYLARHPGDKPYDEALAKDYFARRNGQVYYGRVWPGEVAWPDFGRAEVRRWWSGLHGDFVKAGISGIWCDMNEPAAFYRADKSLPLDVTHRLDGRTTDHREFHNLLGYFNSQAAYNALLPGRPFVLTRSGFAGSWRWAATWTGDNSATWNHMRLSVPQLLNLGVSGFSLAGADVGGYSATPSPLLLTRWMQLGAFNPIFRNHSDGTTRDREPWVDGPEHENARRQAIELRYRLLPYLYTAVEETTRTGVPLMRPMFLEFPRDAALTTLGEQFMLGPSLLVAPQLGEHDYEARLPAGTWYSLAGKATPGGQKVTLNPALDEIPLYVRGGSVLPVAPVAQTTAEKGPLELWVYPGTGKSSLYLDDGARQTLRWSFTVSPEKLTLGAPEGDYRPCETVVVRVGEWTSPPVPLRAGEVQLPSVTTCRASL